MNMMKLFTLVCSFVVDLPHGRRLYCSNPGGNNSLASDSNGGDALNVITSMTSQMYVSPLSKRSMHQAALSTPEMLFFSRRLRSPTNTRSYTQPRQHHHTRTYRHKRADTKGHERVSFLLIPSAAFLCAHLSLIKVRGRVFFPGSAALWDTICRLISSSGGRKKKNYSSRSHSKTGAHAHTNTTTHTRTQTWFASVVDSTEQFYAALIGPVVEDSGKDVEVSVWQGVFEEVP